MKIKSLPIFVLIAVFSSITFAQNVVITPRKITYKRHKPQSEFKKSFTINYPKFKGLNPVLTKKIEHTLSYERVFNFKVSEEIREVQWLEEADYQVDYNKSGILGITLYIEGSGAYPSGDSKPIVINLKTGNPIRSQDVFVRLGQLTAKVKNLQRTEIQQAIIDIKKENPDEEDPAKLFQNTNFTTKNLNEFSINDRGITFWYDYGFPHVIKAWQPGGRYFFSWAELKPFIKPGSLLAKFVR